MYKHRSPVAIPSTPGEKYFGSNRISQGDIVKPETPSFEISQPQPQVQGPSLSQNYNKIRIEPTQQLQPTQLQSQHESSRFSQTSAYVPPTVSTNQYVPNSRNVRTYYTRKI